MDAIQLIQRDHREIERLLKELERADRKDAVDRAEGAARALVRELSTHATMEEQHVYPALRDAGADTRVLDALEEHHAAKVMLAELDALPARHPRFGSKVRVLAESVRRHVEGEEADLLPLLERRLDDDRRRELGERLERAKRAAPTRPHPGAPDTPPGIFLAGAVAAVWDRSRDALRGGTDVLGAIAVQGARQVLESARNLAGRARGRGGEAAAAAAEQGREAADAAARRGRDALDEAREATARVEVRGAEAARTVERRARSAARKTRARKGSERRSAGATRRGGRGRR